jgi:hypothetical protein
MELVSGSLDEPSSQWQVIARVWGPDPAVPIIDCSSIPPGERAAVVSYVESVLNDQMTTTVLVPMPDGTMAVSWLGKLQARARSTANWYNDWRWRSVRGQRQDR